MPGRTSVSSFIESELSHSRRMLPCACSLVVVGVLCGPRVHEPARCGPQRSDRRRRVDEDVRSLCDLNTRIVEAHGGTIPPPSMTRTCILMASRSLSELTFSESRRRRRSNGGSPTTPRLIRSLVGAAAVLFGVLGGMPTLSSWTDSF